MKQRRINATLKRALPPIAVLALATLLILTALPLVGTAASHESEPLLDLPQSASVDVADAVDMPNHSTPLLQSTEVCGAITENTTWTLENSPYVVTCNVTLAEGVTLSIEPGVVVKFDSATRLYVSQSAALTAMGTADNSIYFTSIKDDTVGGDTNGDGDASEPSPGDWRGIRVEDGGALHMDHGHVRYAGHSGCYDCGAVVVWGDAFIDHSVIDNIMDGLAPGVEISHYLDTSASVTIQNSTIRKSRGAAVWGYVIGTVHLFNNVIEVGVAYGGLGPAFDLGCWAGSGSAEEVRIRDNQITFTPDEYSGGTAISVCNVQQGEISNNTLQAVGNSYVPSKGIYVANFPLLIQDNFISDFGVPIDVGSYPNVLPTLAGENFAGNGLKTVGVSGNIGAGTWQQISGYWPVVAGGISIHELTTIPPGVVVKVVDQDARIMVESGGRLEVQGISAQPVVFTSIKDDTVGGDTNGDGDASEPSPGDWRGIKVEDGGALHMDYGHVRYVGHSGCYDCGAVVVGGDAFIDHSVIDNIMDGLAPGVEISHYLDTSASVTIQNSTIRKSRGAAVWGYVIGTVYLLNNVIEVEGDSGSTAAFNLGCWSGSGGSAEEVYIRDNQITFTPDEYYGGTAISVCNVQQGEISNNTLQAVGYSDPPSRGIYATNSPLLIQDNLISDFGVGIYNSAGHPAIQYNNIHDNTEYGVYNADPSTVISAEHNWWGDASGPYHPTTNPDGLGDRVSDHVDFDPWFTSPPSDESPVVLVHGWQGLGIPGIDGNDCTDTPTRVSPGTNRFFGDLPQWLYDLGYTEIYEVNLTTGPGHTPRFEDNAECLRRQLESVTGGTRKAILIAHSMGGLVSRAYMENENLYRNDVARLITVGSPHTGIDWGFLLKILLGLVDCEDDPGTCQLSTEQVLLFDRKHNSRAPGVSYDFIGGRKTPFPLSWFLRLTDGPNDGIVGLASATGKTYWTDLKVVDGQFVSRYQTDETHSGYFGDEPGDTRSCLQYLLGESGTGGSCVEATAMMVQAQAPAIAYSLDVRGHITSSQTVTHSLQVDADGASLFYLSWVTGTLGITLTNPVGTVIDPAYAAAHTDVVTHTTSPGSEMTPPFAAYAFTTTVPGLYTATITTGDVGITGTDYLLFAAMETTRTLSVALDSDHYQIGDTAVLTATLEGAGAGITGATVQATFSRSDAITDTLALTDQGDGTYRGTYAIPNAPGYLHLRVTAEGSDAGTQFNRQVDRLLTVASQAVQLTGTYADRADDADGNGRYETLTVDVEVLAAGAGDFTFSADLVAGGDQFVAHVITQTALITGTQSVPLSFDGELIQDGGSDGPFTVTNLLISDPQNAGIPSVMADDVWTTAAYDHTQFGRITGDMNGDCVVNIVDIMLVASRWSTSIGDIRYDAAYDQDGDGDIDIADIMSVAAHWGETCE